MHNTDVSLIKLIFTEKHLRRGSLVLFHVNINVITIEEIPYTHNLTKPTSY